LKCVSRPPQLYDHSLFIHEVVEMARHQMRMWVMCLLVFRDNGLVIGSVDCRRIQALLKVMKGQLEEVNRCMNRNMTTRTTYSRLQAVGSGLIVISPVRVETVLLIHSEVLDMVVDNIGMMLLMIPWWQLASR
jgi:hypothetical protein